jgi:thiamine biosynthesis lipoprotein
MERTELIMGMPVKITTVDTISDAILSEIFDYCRAVDERYSTYKSTSEISRINAGLPKSKWSAEMRDIFRRCEITKSQTRGYFDPVQPDGTLDPSGIVKGWAVQNAAERLRRKGVTDFSVDAGGDIAVRGDSPSGGEWRIGIRNPFDRDQIVKVVGLRDQGIATSGTAIRGQHIYDPIEHKSLDNIVSLSVIGPNVYDADRFATAAFAMGREGISFIENLKGFEGYMIDKDGIATMTSGFMEYVR